VKLLIAIKSCERDAARNLNKAIRSTWATYFEGKADVRFFIGNGVQPLESDEIRVDAPDDYDGLPYKTRGIARWSVANGYDFTFLCDTDTFVRPELINCGFEQYDYAGHYHDENIVGRMFSVFIDERQQTLYNGYWWASGGIGYFLSRKACEALINEEPTHWAEDLWIGQVMGALYQRGEIKTHGLRPFNSFITWHFPKYQQDVMLWLHTAFRNGRP